MQAHTASRRKDRSCHSSVGETGENGGEECDTTRRKSAERASEQHGDPRHTAQRQQRMMRRSVVKGFIPYLRFIDCANSASHRSQIDRKPISKQKREQKTRKGSRSKRFQQGIPDRKRERQLLG